ncbi:MAG: hypothetical protein AAGF83_12800 [Cyanobacteria bacterium P01_G01_bin.67]
MILKLEITAKLYVLFLAIAAFQQIILRPPTTAAKCQENFTVTKIQYLLA